MIAQPPLDAGTLQALAAAMNQPDVAEARVTRRMKVFVDHGPHVLRCKRVQVDRVFDRNPDWFVFHNGYGFEYSAVTLVVMPPRAVKSPTTVIRRGAQAATRSSRIWLVTDS